jgi:hypothetical protein
MSLNQFYVGGMYMKYNKKMHLLNEDGTLNKEGPGYTYDKKGNLTVTNPILYHKNAERIFKRQNKKLRLSQKIYEIAFINTEALYTLDV